MESVALPNWEAFTAELQNIRDDLTKSASGKTPDLLFRGQSDSSWPLTTTLERADCDGMSFDEYYRLTVHRVRPTVEALTGATWDVPDYDFSMEQAFRSDRELFSLRRFPSVSFYRYMVYLRHHGFPSPLLDWTSSMHVAAFFAFRATGKAETRSIYVYCEMPHGMKGGAVGEPVHPAAPSWRGADRGALGVGGAGLLPARAGGAPRQPAQQARRVARARVPARHARRPGHDAAVAGERGLRDGHGVTGAAADLDLRLLSASLRRALRMFALGPRPR